MILYPNCKINLGLNVVGRRSDGYHDIETVFLPVPLADCLEVEPSHEDVFCMDGRPLDCDNADNLVVRTVRLLRNEGYDVPPVAIRLTKNIPSGAGLGGGSADAAFTMRALNELFGLGLSSVQMRRMVRRLGADCPVFIDNVPVFAEGIGDVFHELPVELVQKTYCMLPPAGAALPPTGTLSIPRCLSGYWLVLVKPDEFISTGEAYNGVRPRPAEHRLREVLTKSVRQWRGRMVNDFEESVFPQHPVVAGIEEQLYMLGAHYASMSGSGSTVYGLFPQRPMLGDVFADHFLWQVEL